jgi:hypothetical protein
LLITPPVTQISGLAQVILTHKLGEIVGNVQPAGMIGAGHQIATYSKDNLYIARE